MSTAPTTRKPIDGSAIVDSDGLLTTILERIGYTMEQGEDWYQRPTW